MGMEELKENLENIEEQLQDAINITHLLAGELESNEEDSHIIRSVSIIGKILDASLETLKKINTVQG